MGLFCFLFFYLVCVFAPVCRCAAHHNWAEVQSSTALFLHSICSQPCGLSRLHSVCLSCHLLGEIKTHVVHSCKKQCCAKIICIFLANARESENKEWRQHPPRPQHILQNLSKLGKLAHKSVTKCQFHLRLNGLLSSFLSALLLVFITVTRCNEHANEG